ncbi:MAG: hypothetical protein ABR576_03715, partial [Thermoanaerobaculia bacterium]
MSVTVPPASAPPKAMDRIRKALAGGHPLIYVVSWEEARVERVVQHLAKTFYGAAAPFGLWTVVDGLVVDGVPVPDTRDPLRVLEAILAASGRGFYLLKDFPMTDSRPEIVRRLRDLYRSLKDRGRHVLLLSPRLVLPEEAKKEVYVVEYELPDEGEISRIIDANARRRIGGEGLDEPSVRRLALAMRGLTADEIGHLVSKVFAQRKVFDEEAFLEVLAEKEQMSK